MAFHQWLFYLSTLVHHMLRYSFSFKDFIENDRESWIAQSLSAVLFSASIFTTWDFQYLPINFAPGHMNGGKFWANWDNVFMSKHDRVQQSRLRSNMSSEMPFDAVSVSTLWIEYYGAFLSPLFTSLKPAKNISASASSAAFCIKRLVCSAKMRFAFSSVIFAFRFSILVWWMGGKWVGWMQVLDPVRCSAGTESLRYLTKELILDFLPLPNGSVFNFCLMKSCSDQWAALFLNDAFVVACHCDDSRLDTAIWSHSRLGWKTFFSKYSSCSFRFDT